MTAAGGPDFRCLRQPWSVPPGCHGSIPLCGDEASEAVAAERRDRTVRREFNVLALIKGNERYIYVYDDDSRQPLIDAFRDQAADPRLNLTWFDAAVLTEKAKEQARAAEPT